MYQQVTRAGSGIQAGWPAPKLCYQITVWPRSVISCFNTRASPETIKTPSILKQAVTYNTRNYCSQISHLSLTLEIYARKRGLLEEGEHKIKILFPISFDSLSCLLQEKLEDRFISLSNTLLSFTYLKASWSSSGWIKRIYFRNKRQATILTAE